MLLRSNVELSGMRVKTQFREDLEDKKVSKRIIARDIVILSRYQGSDFGVSC